jgi:hypothetical protein
VNLQQRLRYKLTRLQLNQATPELVQKKRQFIEELERRLQTRFGPALGVMSIGLDAYGPPLNQAPFELALYVSGTLDAP